VRVVRLLFEFFALIFRFPFQVGKSWGKLQVVLAAVVLSVQKEISDLLFVLLVLVVVISAALIIIVFMEGRVRPDPILRGWTVLVLFFCQTAGNWLGTTLWAGNGFAETNASAFLDWVESCFGSVRLAYVKMLLRLLSEGGPLKVWLECLGIINPVSVLEMDESSLCTPKFELREGGDLRNVSVSGGSLQVLNVRVVRQLWWNTYGVTIQEILPDFSQETLFGWVAVEVWGVERRGEKGLVSRGSSVGWDWEFVDGFSVGFWIVERGQGWHI
jgi:hypothetical protein